jgi:hypothetical protein
VPGTTAAKAEAGTVDCNKLNQPTEFKILDHAAVAVLKNRTTGARCESDYSPSECSRKKRSSSLVASGPRGSV